MNYLPTLVSKNSFSCSLVGFSEGSNNPGTGKLDNEV